MSHFGHQRSLATELTTFHLENKTQAVLVINGLRKNYTNLGNYVSLVNNKWKMQLFHHME